MARWFGWQVLVCTLLCWRTSEAEIIEGSVRLSSQNRDSRVQYVTKFACSIGECRYRARAGIKAGPWSRLNAPVDPNATAKAIVRIILDEEWDTTKHLSACERAELGRGRTTLTVPLDGSFGPWATNTFRQTYRPHFWYFVIEDCRNSILSGTEKYGVASSQDVSLNLKYELEVTQVGGSHVSYEHYGMAKWYFLHLLVFAGLLAWMIYKQTRVMKSQRFELHIMTQMLNASVIVNVLGSLFHLWHLGGINSTGKPTPFLEALADGCFIISQVVVSSCLIMISLGVTLNAPERYPVPVVLAIVVAIAVVHFIVILADKFTSDPRYKYYGSEGSVGTVLLFFRLGLWVIFLLGWHATRTHKWIPPATERFLRRTVLPASAYFLTFPIILLLMGLCKPYWRHAAFFHATFILNVISIFWLAEVFLNKGEYFAVSTMSRSFLPGGVWRPTVAAHRVD